MKRIAAAAVFLATIAASSFSHASTIQEYTGHVHVGALDLGASEFSNVILEGCTDEGTADGVDGFMIKLDDADLGRPFTLTTTGASGQEDADLNFWDEACANLGETFDAEGPEAGTVPATARFASVVLFTGVEADVSMKVTRS